MDSLVPRPCALWLHPPEVFCASLNLSAIYFQWVELAEGLPGNEATLWISQSGLKI